MIEHPAFEVAPWRVRETQLDLDVLAQTEPVFALANRHIGWRGNFDEGEPHGLPGSYLGGVYELRWLPYAEAEYGYPESGQTVVNVTNGKLIRLRVDDEPFDVRYRKLPGSRRFAVAANLVPGQRLRLTAGFSRSVFMASASMWKCAPQRPHTRSEKATPSTWRIMANKIRVMACSPLTCPIAPGADRIAPCQPSGREPLGRKDCAR
ncbi:glycoside hydrolase family 65 domain protein [Segniliparus rotundus DSM 44985]|uniref:Glycoside hydrolase family 65 domain protein n=1 Tax=Segniliparus rotundus (strain ATCC BAA-972 / CDC 1076 / CIP 108378 / DSM 44985 / JCM 13578) TaxID=640132 RepID=D6ZAT3_SEGRD|nr:glycoside hydrolase family 65 domain protein [Segniliparus rotundus DSM 44985]